MKISSAAAIIAGTRNEVAMFPKVLLAACLSALLVGACARQGGTTGAPAVPPQPAPATLVLRNGNIVTVDPARPAAQAIAMRGDTIAAVGTDEEIQKLTGPSTEVIDLQGKTAIPGLIEGHGHLMNLGDAKRNLDLMDVKNWDEIVAMVGEAAKKAKPGDWILGRGWHQEKWDKKPEPNVEGFPLHDALSAASPNNPVLLTHASGHATFVNARAMELSAINPSTPNPAGGEILKDAAGKPIGVLRETASDLPNRVLLLWRTNRTPAEQQADARQKIELAVKEALANGVTSFQDAGEDFVAIDHIKAALGDGALGIRVWVMVRDSNANLRAKLPSYKAVGLGDKRLTIAAIKKTMDGALGSRGAWMLADYADLLGRTGLATFPVAEMEETARIALENNVQFCVHAIGDRANREVLNIFEAAFKSKPQATDFRWRIEHAQHLNAADIPRFGKLGVIASMQGIHATSDAPYVLARLGAARAEEGAYVWRKLMQSGATISNGTDTPVERISPIANYYSSVTRKLKDGTAFYPEQRMSREEGLKTMTINAAYAAKEETIKGSLTVGKLADVTVLSNDLLKVPEEQILSTKIVYTIVGGKVAYRGQ